MKDRVLGKGASWILSALLIIAAFGLFLPAMQGKAFALQAGTITTQAGTSTAEEDGVSYDNYTSNQELYNKLTGQDQEPIGYTDDLAKSVDPYGYGVDVPFYLNKQSELVVYATNDFRNDTTSQRTIKSYNLPSGSNVGNILTGAESSESYDVPMAGGQVKKPLNYVKMVAFDPTGSGRDDHLAVVGVYNEDFGNDDGAKSLWVYVYNKYGSNNKSSLVSDYLKLGNMDWLGDHGNDNDAAWYYNALNFLSITAGDYDGDGKDTLVIWGCFDNTGYGLQEVKVKETASAITLEKGDVSRALLHDEYVSSGGTLASAHKWVDNKLCCALDTGDVNGDKVDDLVALSFVDIMTESDGGRTQRTQMYAPYLAVSYGGSGVSSVINKKDAYARVMKQTGSSSGIAQYLTCMAADVSAGDINGDGVDEIVIGGVKNEIRGNLDTLVDSAYVDSRIQESLTLLAAFRCSGSVMDQLCLETHNANAWTSRGYYPKVNGSSEYEDRDQCLQQYAVECFAVNGKGNPYMVFVNGDIYKFEDSTMKCVHESDYFEESDTQFLSTGTNLTNTFFVSTAAGNFDGNDKGYEQVAYTFAVKTQSHERYHLAAGIAGGDFTKQTTEAGLAKYYYSTSENTYENSANRNVYFPSKDDTRYVSANLSHNYGLNYCICAIDNDEDGILVRFHDKGYAYTDPDILGVLQAAPHYDELSDYGANDNETTYSFSKSISYEDTESDSVSFGAGVTQGLEGTVGGYEVKAGYAMDWSSEFTEGFTETKEYSFTADKDDAVVLFRTPVTMYYYQVKLPSGEWSDAADPKDETNGLVLSFPGTPAYSIISVDKYNEFAAYYNKTNEARMSALGKSLANTPKLALLTDTDTQRLYLNTEGDPAKYMSRKALPSGVKILQDKANAFEVSTGSTSFSYGTEHSTSTSDSMSHGFNFELTIEFDLGIKCFVSSSVGAYVSLEYMHGNTHTSTNAEGKGVSCSVSNANQKDMVAAGYSDAACNSYGYSYQMAQWASPIYHDVPVTDPKTDVTTMTSENVPIFGYVLSDVKKPTFTKIKAPQSLTLSEGYGASTSGTFLISGDPVPTITKVSGDSKIVYNAITRKLEVAPGLKIGTYTVKLKAANGIPGKDFTCSYKVQVKAPDYSETGMIDSVKALIGGLPDPKELLLADEVYVKQARAAYDALTDAQKAKVDDNLKTKLQKAEKQIQGFKSAASEADTLIASAVPDLCTSISALANSIEAGTVPAAAEVQALVMSLSSIEDVYNELNNDQKTLVSNESTAALAGATIQLAQMVDKYDKATKTEAELNKQAAKDREAASKVKVLIEDVGDLGAINPATTDEEQFELLYQTALKAADAARKAYNSLTVQQKALVENADQLISAEKTLGTLLTQRCIEVVAQQDAEACNDAVAKLKKIPAKITLKSDGAVIVARYAYDHLSASAKAKVAANLLTKLKAAEKKMASFRKAIEKNAPVLKKAKGVKKGLKANWKKLTKKVGGAKVTGYEVQVATNNKFTKNKKTAKVNGSAKKASTIKKLKAKKKYFVRVRAYTKTSTAIYYSKWSKVKSTKTK